MPQAAQNPATPLGTTAAAPASNAVPAGMHGIVQLDGPWRFQIGDDPRWADSSFDDSVWPTLVLDKSLAEQGFETYAGYAWYRVRVQPQQLRVGGMAGNTPLHLLVTSHSIGQLAVYINGVELGHTHGMTDAPRMYESPPFDVTLPDVPAGSPMVIAVRTWAAPGVPISHGLLEKAEVGSHDDVADRLMLAIARKWDQQVIAEMILAFLFLGVAALGLILYLAQRHHSEYLWLALMCFAVAVKGAVELCHWLAIMSSETFDFLDLWTGRIFMAVTIEFVLRFADTSRRQFARGFQIAVLVLPLVSLVGLHQVYDILSIAAEVVFCILVCVLLYRSWRKGFREAGIMLVPFLLAATADSIDSILEYLASKHWGISEEMAVHHIHVGPIVISIGLVTYAIFLSSLLAVIIYRFVHVSQEEQRSNAEIAAARSVQSMLIPTELPSNSYFMLESAYVPVNGVGGDFFQVLPVDDGSILIVVGDVSGKGLQAAMNASTIVGAFRNELSHDPATILKHLNQVILGAASGMGQGGRDVVASFATCLCARIYRNGMMEIANAGHLSPYRDGREVELPPGLPLGVIPGMTYEQCVFQLEQGDRLIFLSDGVVEATDAQGELFGFERTQQVSNEPARYIAQTAKRFGQNDDITVISIYIASRDAKQVEALEEAYPR